MRKGAVLVGCVILTLCVSSAAWAQSGRGEIQVEVRDPSGSLVPNASALLTNAETNEVSTGITSSQGICTFPGLRPGSYSLTIEAPGFRHYTRANVQVATGERIPVEVQLRLGGIEESVIINATTPLLNTESGDLGQVIGNRAILDLPLNGRNFVPVIGIATGVALPPGSSFPRINGGRPRTNEYLFDGISVLQPEPGQVAFFPIIDAIQDFKVEVNSAPAEFGRFNGGLVNLTTKSGTNELHGSVFEFLRYEAFNARNLFAPVTASTAQKPRFRRNQYGIVAGGPIAKNRSFFFVNYQGTRQSIGRVQISTVPTSLQREGIFTETIGGVAPKVYDPDTTRPGPSGHLVRDPFADSAIPSTRLDPVAVLLLGRYPLPNLPGTANNFRRIGNEEQDQDQFDMRIDHRFSPHDQAFGRFSFARDVSNPVAPLPDGSGNLSSGTIGLTKTEAYSLASGCTHDFLRAANDLRFGYTRRSIDRTALLLDPPPQESLSLPGIPSNAAFRNALPTFAISGFQQLGPSSNANSNFRTDVTQLTDTFSMQRGRHFLKAGLDFRWERLDVVQPTSPTGLFRFTTLFTDLPGTAGTGNPLASFLLGQVQDFSIDLQQKAIRPRAHVEEYFIQDDWKAARRLTINAGVRYTLNFPSTEADNQGAVFSLQTQNLQYLGRDGFPRSARELHKLNFGPRFGLAFRPEEKTVLRGGYGLIWIEQAGITTPCTNPQFPFIQSVTQRTLDNITPAFVLSAGPSVTPIAPTQDAGLGQGVFSVDRTLGSGYAQQWNLAMQRELTASLTIEIAYAGSKITHVGIPDTNINQLTADQLRLGSALLERVPNPFFGVIPRSSSLGDPTIPRAQLLKPFSRFTTVSFFRNNVGNTNYHSLQLKAEKRSSRGLFFLISYTRSKLIDEASSVFDASILTGPVANFPVADSFNRMLERDVSNGDIPNVFVAAWTWQVPFGPGRFLNPRGLASWILRDWDLSGVVTMQSGLPLAVSQATNFNAFAGFGTQRPNRISNPELPPSARSTAKYFDTGAFQTAPQFSIGNSSRNPVRGPGFRGADIALIRRTLIHEGITLEVRAEIFNLTNTPPLGAPNTVLGTPGFGSITSAGDPRVIQLGVKLHF
jgi:hypothetical protein